MTTKQDWREVVRGALFENLWLKIVSLVCALGLYAFIHGAENAQRTLAVSVVSIMPPESANRVLLTQLPTEVTVTVRGSRTQLDDLRADDLGSLQLDLRSGRESRVDLDASMIHVPAGIRVDQLYPASLELRWDDMVTRPIPIQVARAGEPQQGFVVKGGVTADPANVVAHGPRTIVDALQFARAAPFDVTGLSEGSSKRPLPLDKPPKLVSYDIEMTTGTVEIVRQMSNKTLTNVRVEVVGVPRATVTPKTVTITLVGSEGEINAVLPEAIVPRVEPRTANLDVGVAGSAYLDVLVEVPRVKVEVSPPKVLVKW